jgi:hypothetical protein
MVFLKTLSPLRKVIFNQNGTKFIFVIEKPFGVELAIGSWQLAIKYITPGFEKLSHRITKKNNLVSFER